MWFSQLQRQGWSEINFWRYEVLRTECEGLRATSMGSAQSAQLVRYSYSRLGAQPASLKFGGGGGGVYPYSSLAQGALLQRKLRSTKSS